MNRALKAARHAQEALDAHGRQHPDCDECPDYCRLNEAVAHAWADPGLPRWYRTGPTVAWLVISAVIAWFLAASVTTGITVVDATIGSSLLITTTAMAITSSRRITTRP